MLALSNVLQEKCQPRPLVFVSKQWTKDTVMGAQAAAL
jgi:hypothetical protein